jgi:hypothetical protein
MGLDALRTILAVPRAAIPRAANPRLAIPRLAIPRAAIPRLTIPRLVILRTAVCALLAAMGAQAAGPAPAPGPAPRVEARSADLVAVGVVQGDRMSIHLSRLLDNAPVQDAVLRVLLRGVEHQTLAEPDGGYTMQTPDLTVPGGASLEFRVLRGQSREDLKGVLVVADAAADTAKNGARQLWWWVLNFGVCGGFLLLLARRRKAGAARDKA